jgi:hypothetical protein
MDGLPKSVFVRRLLLVRGVVAARIVVTSNGNETAQKGALSMGLEKKSGLDVSCGQGYIKSMKTTISLPKDVFEKALISY